MTNLYLRIAFFSTLLLAGTARAAVVPRKSDPSPAAAAPAPVVPLTLSHAFELAAQRNERLDIQAEEIEQAKAAYRETRGGVLPNLRFNATKTIQDTSGTTGGGGGDTFSRSTTQRDRTEVKFTLRQPIFQGFKEFAALKGLKASEAREKLLFQREATLLYQDVALAFFRVVQFETELADLQILMGLSKDRIGDLRERSQLGKSRGSEVATAESQYATYRAQEAGLQGDIAVAREGLSFVIGEPIGNRPVVDSLPLPVQAPPVEELVSRSRDRSDIAALREEVNARKAGIRVALASYSPSLTATGNYYLARPSGSQEEIDWDAIFFLDMPIFQGGAARAYNLEARSLLRQTESDLARLSRLTESDVRVAHAELASSIDEAKLFEDAYQKSRRSYDLLVKDYRLGLANNLDVLQLMNSLQSVKRDFDIACLQSKLNLLNLRLSVEMSPEDLP